MAQVLTVKSIDAHAAGQSRQELPDALLPGLYLVVQPSGMKSWALRYRLHGRPSKFTLGPYPAIGLAKARDLGRAALEGVAAGVDPAAGRRAQKVAMEQGGGNDFKSVAARFIERYAKQNTREATWKEYERLLDVNIVPRWRSKPIEAITSADVVALLDGIVDSGTAVLANRILAVIRRLFNWTVERGLLDRSPCEKIKAPAAEVSRDRVLADAEIRLIWQACDSQGWPFGPFVKLLLLTGQRRNEVAQATWAEIDIAGRLWTIPKERTKNGIAQDVQLSAAALEILNGLPRITAKAGDKLPGFVFTTSGKSPIAGYSKAKTQIDLVVSRICEEQSIDAPERWTFHDLRRTIASGMARLGISVVVVEKILNHSGGTLGGVTGVYQRHTFAEERRRALETWATFVEGLMNAKGAPSKVVPMVAR